MLQSRARHLTTRVALVLFSAVLCIVLLHAFFAGGSSDSILPAMFDVSDEGNVPTWFASILWFLVACTAFACYGMEGERRTALKFRWMWVVIALVFLIASADEVATIHEQIGTVLQEQPVAASHPLSQLQARQDSPHSPWLVFYLPLLGVFGAVAAVFLLSRFWRQRALAICFMLSVDCYALSLAFDHFQGLPVAEQERIAINWRQQRVEALIWSYVVEEVIEDVGTVLLIVAFVGHAANLYFGNDRQNLKPENET